MQPKLYNNASLHYTCAFDSVASKRYKQNSMQCQKDNTREFEVYGK